MREFETTFAKGLKKGLREDDENPRNEEALVECLNVKPSEEGLTPIVAITTPMTVSMAWPFPQVFKAGGIGGGGGETTCAETTDVGYSGDDPIVMEVSDTSNVTITNGLPPFTWAITGTGLSWTYETTRGRTNILNSAASISDGSWTVTDRCTNEVGGDIETIKVCPDSVLYTLEFDTADCLAPMGIHLDGDYYAVVYQSSNSDGWLRTFSISAAGEITAVDNWEFNTTNGTDPTIYSISGTMYLIAASAAGGTGALYTVSISDVGVISKSLVDTEALTDATSSINTLVNITGDVYSISWRTPDRTHISTYTITAAGSITLIDDYAYALTNLFPSWSYLVAANVIMDVILATADEFRVTTYGISDAGSITTPYLDTQAIALPGDTYQRTWGVEVTSNMFAITMQSADEGGYVATFGVDDAGNIDAAVTDSYLYVTGIANDSNGHILDLGEDGAFLLSYQGADGDGFTRTIDISDAGAITARSACSILEFDESYCLNPFALPRNGAYLPVFYIGPDGDGYLKTIGMA